MDKELFKDKNPLLRRQMLEDNCAAVERITYTSPFSEEEMGERKTELANIDLDMPRIYTLPAHENITLLMNLNMIMV